jgi:hypothetical protein
MPAASSSPIDPVIGQLIAAARCLDEEDGRLLPVLAAVPDPRARRGVRHRLAAILGLALCAVLAGARSFTAIAEWAADADQATRDALGVTGVVPCESTFRRTLQAMDADALDEAAGGWAQQRTAPAAGTRRAIAVRPRRAAVLRRSNPPVRSWRRRNAVCPVGAYVRGERRRGLPRLDMGVECDAPNAPNMRGRQRLGEWYQ